MSHLSPHDMIEMLVICAADVLQVGTGGVPTCWSGKLIVVPASALHFFMLAARTEPSHCHSVDATCCQPAANMITCTAICHGHHGWELHHI